LATFEVQKVSDTYDDLSDLKPSELDQVGSLPYVCRRNMTHNLAI
jgi:hypothetical protein